MKLAANAAARAWATPSPMRLLSNLAALREERSQLHALLAMDDHLLLDIGLLRQDVEFAESMLRTYFLAVGSGRTAPPEERPLNHLHRVASERQARSKVPRPHCPRLLGPPACAEGA
jgi:uncharacterized protein YjiS (DUF1127 family)